MKSAPRIEIRSAIALLKNEGLNKHNGPSQWSDTRSTRSDSTSCLLKQPQDLPTGLLLDCLHNYERFLVLVPWRPSKDKVWHVNSRVIYSRVCYGAICVPSLSVTQPKGMSRNSSMTGACRQIFCWHSYESRWNIGLFNLEKARLLFLLLFFHR